MNTGKLFVIIQREYVIFLTRMLSPYYYNLNNYVANSSDNFIWNMRRIQGDSNYCGFYCIFYLIYACRNNLKNFYNKFNLELNKNDFIITNELFRN